jgi:hypothetical protein
MFPWGTRESRDRFCESKMKDSGARGASDEPRSCTPTHSKGWPDHDGLTGRAKSAHRNWDPVSFAHCPTLVHL